MDISCGPFAQFPFQDRHVIIWSKSLLQFTKPQNWRIIFPGVIVYIFPLLAYMKQYSMNE